MKCATENCTDPAVTRWRYDTLLVLLCEYHYSIVLAEVRKGRMDEADSE